MFFVCYSYLNLTNHDTIFIMMPLDLTSIKEIHVDPFPLKHCTHQCTIQLFDGRTRVVRLNDNEIGSLYKFLKSHINKHRWIEEHIKEVNLPESKLKWRIKEIFSEKSHAELIRERVCITLITIGLFVICRIIIILL